MLVACFRFRKFFNLANPIFISKIICLAILFVSCTGNQNGVKNDILKKLREVDRYEGAFIGEAPVESSLYQAAEELMNLCSDDELIKFLDDENPVVKCYAANFIGDKNIKAGWYDILLNEIEDYEKLNVQYGDIIFNPYAGDFVIDSLFDKKLSAVEQKKLKEATVQKQSHLKFASSVLLGEEKSDELYAAEREWALKGNANAIYSLAKYKKNEDLQLIETLKDKNQDLFFKACGYNMSDSHKPFLRDYMISIMPEEYWHNEWKSFYKLVADYHDDFSREIFDMTFSDKVNANIQKYHLEFIYEAIKKFTDDFYGDYLKNLWMQYNIGDVKRD